MKTQNHKNNHVHFGHLGAVIFCALILVGITFMKNGFKFTLIGNNNKQSVAYTYEQAKAEALAELGQTNINNESDKTVNQIAILDPTSAEGLVAGASTGTDDSLFPKAEETFTPEVLDKIKIKINDTTGVDAIRQYKKDLELAESESGTEGILASLNSSDTEVLSEVPKKVQTLVANLMLISVPQELSEYHKFKLVYYMELSALAEGYAGATNVPDPKDVGISIFSVMDRLQRISNEIQNKYGVQL